MDDLDEKFSMDRIEENIKQIEADTLEKESAIVNLQTSIQRKKKQLVVNLNEMEQDIDDEITNTM
jgi:hypothetical protein